MNRYENIQIKRNFKNNKVYKTVLYPKIEVDETDIYISPSTEDRLDLLAYKYYGDPSLWWIIAHANHIGKGTMKVLSGKQLRIPQNLNKIFSDFRNLNENK